MAQSNGNGPTGGHRGGRSRPHPKNRTLAEMVQADPVACVAIAMAAGFILGGGARRAGGFTILTMLGQIVVRETLGESASLSELFSEA